MPSQECLDKTNEFAENNPPLDFSKFESSESEEDLIVEEEEVPEEIFVDPLKGGIEPGPNFVGSDLDYQLFYLQNKLRVDPMSLV
jgi:hypothetical protein